jgi:hypothetical protein
MQTKIAKPLVFTEDRLQFKICLAPAGVGLEIVECLVQVEDAPLLHRRQASPGGVVRQELRQPCFRGGGIVALLDEEEEED